MRKLDSRRYGVWLQLHASVLPDPESFVSSKYRPVAFCHGAVGKDLASSLWASPTTKQFDDSARLDFDVHQHFW